LGILLEDAGYKRAIKEGSVLGLISAFASGVGGGNGNGNPLKSGKDKQMGYEGMNRDSGAYLPPSSLLLCLGISY
jgi:hypothetical protein